MTARVRRSIRGAKKRGGAKTPPKKTGLRVRSNKKGGLKLVMSPKLPIKLYKSAGMK